MLTNTLRTALHKQVDDLQSQSVIPAEASRYIPAPTMPQAGPEQQEAARKKEEGRITNGGLGKLDIAELNARAGVGREGDEEVLKRLVGIVEVLREKMGEQAEGEEKEGELAVDG